MLFLFFYPLFFLFCTLDHLFILLLILIFYFYFCFVFWFFSKRKVNVNSIIKVIKIYKRNTNTSKKTIFFLFFANALRFFKILLEDINKKKIIKNHKIGVWMVEMHWKHIFFLISLFFLFLENILELEVKFFILTHFMMCIVQSKVQ
jgi:hypothetical protein